MRMRRATRSRRQGARARRPRPAGKCSTPTRRGAATGPEGITSRRRRGPAGGTGEATRRGAAAAQLRISGRRTGTATGATAGEGRSSGARGWRGRRRRSDRTEGGGDVVGGRPALIIVRCGILGKLFLFFLFKHGAIPVASPLTAMRCDSYRSQTPTAVFPFVARKQMLHLLARRRTRRRPPSPHDRSPDLPITWLLLLLQAQHEDHQRLLRLQEDPRRVLDLHQRCGRPRGRHAHVH